MEKINTFGRCVYTSPSGLCPGTSPLHPKEHYLPAGLGNFKDDLRLKYFICYDCQKRFSQYEEVFLRNGTEAFFRSILGFRGRKSHDGKNIFIEPTLGLPPLTVKGTAQIFSEHELLWQMTSETEAYLMNQLVFRKPDDTLVHLPIRDGRIASDLARFGDEWKLWRLLTCIGGAGQEKELQSVLGPALENMKDIPEDALVGHEIEGEMKAQISLPYVQAIAKIGFHFVLAHFHFTGYEPEFDDLKRFIYSGQGEPSARIVDDIILPQLIPEEARLRQWSHILTAEFNDGGFFGRMQFFVGPQLKPFVWRLNLGANPSRILPQQAQGFRYGYYEVPDASGYVGAIEALELGPQMRSQQ